MGAAPAVLCALVPLIELPLYKLRVRHSVTLQPGFDDSSCVA